LEVLTGQRLEEPCAPSHGSAWIHTLEVVALSIALCCGACTGLATPAQRKQHADTLAGQHHWRGLLLRAGEFELVAYMPDSLAPATDLTIYIEGDGLAWITATRASRDPTPLDPLALRLALAQPEGAAAYLGRPCQYVDAELSHCRSRYWTEARFSSDVVVATDTAVELLRERFGARSLTLVGYSGGAAVAALVAGKRRDVHRLITVAGNLDPAAWAEFHHLAPLAGSQNPADSVTALQGVAQTHLVGERDTNVTPQLVRLFAALFPENEHLSVTVVPGFDHHCCWVQQWPSLWRNITD
jgi:dienelactone hydrolase